ncbi:MAG: 4Fe-4S binding protein [Desulfobacterales bacterium]
MDEVYLRLREHLDRLPAGFPATPSGVELRILRRLFLPEEAELALHVGMKLETAEEIGRRAGLDPAAAAARLRAMARKGLIFSIETPGRPEVFMAAQFVIGIWEYHVNDLDPELIRDMDEYIPVLSRTAFGALPQLRTIPVGRSLQPGLEVMAYEQAEELVRAQKRFLVAPCICRREHKIKGEGCDRLMEACLIFGWGAEFYARNGLGRFISLEETLSILKTAEEEGLVIQPSNCREIVNICLCCGDCCQILKHLKRMPQPGRLASSAFLATLDETRCTACGTCGGRCPMEAIGLQDDRVRFDPDRCIGCGLCVSTCPGEALRLVRRPPETAPPVPKDMREAFLLRTKMRLARHGNPESAEPPGGSAQG